MATVAKRNGKWWIDYRDRQGVRRRERARTRKEATELLAKRTGELKRGTYQAPGKEKTFEELAEAFEKATRTHVKENTWTDYDRNLRLHLRPFFDGFKLPEITVADVERFVSDRIEHEIGKRTVNKCLTLLVSMFKHGQKHAWLYSNPAQHVKKLKTRETDKRDDVDESVLSPAEFQTVLEKIDPKWWLIIKTAGLTGLRQGELIGLRWKNVDLEKSEIHVREQYTSGRFSDLKTKSARRTVPLSAELVQDLKNWKNKSDYWTDDDLVFATLTGGPQNHSNLTNRGWRPALEKAKVRIRPFHTLRHTFASALIRNNVSMKVVSHLCGHSSIGITMDVYSHLLPDSTDGIAEALAETMLGEGGHQMVTDRSTFNQLSG